MQGKDSSVQQAQFDLCLVLLAVARFEATKHRVKVAVHVDKSRKSGLFVLDLHEQPLDSHDLLCLPQLHGDLKYVVKGHGPMMSSMESRNLGKLP